MYVYNIHQNNNDMTKTVKVKAPVRPLNEIANEIRKDWKPVSNYARPYLDAMSCLDKITDSYGMDSAKMIVNYFLSNASSWRGEVAKRIKAELKEMVK
jgi:hypothetical protein